MNKYKLSLIMVSGIFLGLLIFAYWILFPFKTVKFFNEPFPVNTPVHAGQLMSYQVNYCRYTTAAAQFTRTLTGPTLVTIVDSSAVSPKGCRTVTVSNTVIPSYVLPGTYHMNIHACFHINPLRNICKDMKTQDFKVLLPERDKHGNIVALPEAGVNNSVSSVFLSTNPNAQPSIKTNPSGISTLEIEITPPKKPVTLPDLKVQTRTNPITNKVECKVVGDLLWVDDCKENK